ncbi:helix-turn-helix transcriptional regulator [Azospirillum sp. B506]|uniref:helix-turn-helix transcriptional regulator n=2 Tax=Azospirillum sp. B506 TaxID=137721 RepID=UPI0003493030|nr:helix-turn-helix transcriptional regulator [Azospirillum sp. B506]
MAQDADSLIEDIYDAVTFPERWGGILERLCTLTDATHGFLFTTGPRYDSRTAALWARHNITDRQLADYTTHFRHRDVWANAAAARGLLNRCVVRRGEELVPDAVLRRSAFFNELLRDHGMGRLCALALSDGGELAPMQPVLSLFRPADASPFPDETVRLLQDCAPHIQRAMRLRVRLLAREDGGDDARWSGRAVDRLPIGIALLDAAGRIVGMNRAGRAMIDMRDGLRLQHGRLQAEQGAEARRLTHVLDAAVSTAGRGVTARRGEAADLRVSRPSGRASYLLTVLPLSPETAVGPFGDADGGDGVRIRAAVYIVDPAAVTPGVGKRLGALFGLTPVEAGLVADLLADLTPAEIGGRRGVAISTVRSQLRNIFAKTGTTRQSELMNLVNRCLMLPEGP